MTAVHFKSDLDEALHASALALHRIGALDAATMREFEASYRATPEPSAGHKEQPNPRESYGGKAKVASS